VQRTLGLVLPLDPKGSTAPASLSVPVLAGCTAEEVSMSGMKDAQGFEELVKSRYGDFAGKLISLYPHADAPDAASSAILLSRDRYKASLLIWAHSRVQAGGGPVPALVKSVRIYARCITILQLSALVSFFENTISDHQ
jgi:para-nitrobenzyl esterase